MTSAHWWVRPCVSPYVLSPILKNGRLAFPPLCKPPYDIRYSNWLRKASGVLPKTLERFQTFPATLPHSPEKRFRYRVVNDFVSRSEKTGKNWNRDTNLSGQIPPKWLFLDKSHQKIWLGGKEGMPDVSRFEKTAEIWDRDTNCVELRRSAAIDDRSQPVFACTTHFPPSPTHYRRFAAPFGVRNPSIGVMYGASLHR